ncbi:MAG: hypothetical protein DIJKHBIC_01680 [Thermoanaerobaculia bacterium]|nr:hypothetical protein [Thermoanaerobaculia bacterium]
MASSCRVARAEEAFVVVAVSGAFAQSASRVRAVRDRGREIAVEDAK